MAEKKKMEIRLKKESQSKTKMMIGRFIAWFQRFEILANNYVKI